MNTDTKRHIDAARQVLVGVVPNPTSQIDQITNALIYKFMDDMDQAAIKAGGKPSFFVDDLEKYAWTRLMDARIGNQERMNLYSEALMKFSQADQLPPLFRGIFKSAFLPYRSPETLGLFLKEIDYFDYSHPEELGNAYEYLLSIMSSQGDAGQFRTPRHIIDFIVDVVDPKKDEKILDPACGTGGFLVSSYLHILEQHTNKKGEKKKKKELNPEEKKKMMNNFEGYDIDPTMVRIAQVNMYLHQFKNPKIVQYNTLSQEERWGEKFDVILANPPFMSPKGGVKTHTRFSVPSSRSEVLFVDYIMNHLRPKGRAGIIVPEGIIFQSGSAHKELRKNLVNDGLYAVVSLPSGIFQPYSGVKTSILLFDNELAKKSKEILFIKIENDGFDLGAQRRVSAKNDLPMALDILNNWRAGEKVENKIVSFVERSRIAENDDHNLSGDRYRIATDYSNAKWPMVKLLKLEDDGKIEFLRGQGLSKADLKEEGKNKCIHYGEIYTLYDVVIRNIFSKTDIEGRIKSLKGDVLVPATTTADAMGISVARSLNENGVVLGGDINIIRTKNKFILSNYLAFLISNPPLKIELSKSAKGANILHLSNTDLKRLQIPLPPLEIQEQIVAELDAYQNIINGAKQIVKNWKPKIDIDPEWEKVKLGEVCEIFGGGTPSRVEEKYWGGNIPWLSARYFSDDHTIKGAEMITEEGLKNSSSKIAPKGSTILITRVSVGKFAVADQDYAINQDLTALVPKNKELDPKYLWLVAEVVASKIKDNAIGVGVTGVTRDFVVNQEIPFPSLVIQKQIVEKIEAERVLVESSKKLIEIYEENIKEVIGKLWSEQKCE